MEVLETKSGFSGKELPPLPISPQKACSDYSPAPVLAGLRSNSLLELERKGALVFCAQLGLQLEPNNCCSVTSTYHDAPVLLLHDLGPQSLKLAQLFSQEGGKKILKFI